MESVVYLYSKYSASCKEFSDRITTSTLKDSFNLLCVDNKDIRKVVVSSKYSIKSIPCVLCVFSNSVIEKYEGEQAFRWLDQFVIPASPIRKSPPVLTKLVEICDEEEEEEPKPIVVKKKTRKQISNETSAQKTSIDDILSSNADDEEEEQEPAASNINAMIKKSTKPSKASDIMNMAQQLQKLREEEETEKTKNK